MLQTNVYLKTYYRMLQILLKVSNMEQNVTMLVLSDNTESHIFFYGDLKHFVRCDKF